MKVMKIKEINDAIKLDVKNSGKMVLTEAQYNEVLDFFALGGAAITTTLNIGAGFDILQWAPDYSKIPENKTILDLIKRDT
jgi:hypothetical protein